MIKIENPRTVGWESATRGMRNPMNSWDKSDSAFWGTGNGEGGFGIGPNDLALMKKLAAAGPDHRKFMRMLVVYVDVTAPLYFWKEMETYKVGTVSNSCSTMHKIHEKEFTLEDFSCEHLIDEAIYQKTEGGDTVQCNPLARLKCTISDLNVCRAAYLETKDKKYWWQLIQMLPSSHNQRRTLMMNYEVLRNIYHARKNHKLDEWREFCKWIETLPYAAELITGEG